MKYLNILLVSMIVALNSCTDMLELSPEGSLPIDTYFSNDKQVDAALTAVYDVFGKDPLYGVQYVLRYGLQADEGFVNEQSNVGEHPWTYNHQASHAMVLSLWKTIYMGINRANLLLYKLDNPTKDNTITPDFMDVAKGEALFLRGYYYFLLAQNFGGVPIVLTPTTKIENTDLKRSSLRDVYDQILDDMEKAESLVLSASKVKGGGRISKSAVRGVLARVCLYMAGKPLEDREMYDKVIYWADQVINVPEGDFTHALQPDYRTVFKNYMKDLYDVKESIWEVEFFVPSAVDASNEYGGVGAEYGIACNDITIGRCYSRFNVSHMLWNRYTTSNVKFANKDVDSVRREWNIANHSYVGPADNSVYTLKPAITTGVGNGKNFWVRNFGKFRRSEEPPNPYKGTLTSGINYPLLRYSDVLLMYAEAENEVNTDKTQACWAINQVRRRAFKKMMPDAQNIAEFDIPTSVSHDELLAEIKDERSRELCLESLRKADLVRWGDLQTAAQNAVALLTLDTYPADNYFVRTYSNMANPKHLFIPIPASEIGLNRNLEQNPLWN